MLGASILLMCRMTAAIYRTTDVYLASFLLDCEATLAGCRRLRPKKTEFQFVADLRLHQLLRLYWSGMPTPLVPAELLKTLRDLKRRALAEPLPQPPLPLAS